MNLPRIDIVLVARNEEKYLAACLDSIQAQTYPGHLITVYLVDNGSTDATREIALRYSCQYISQPAGMLGALRNTAIRQGSGELVAFLDAHCVAEKDWLLSLFFEFAQDARLGGCGGPIEFKFDDPCLEALQRRTGFYCKLSESHAETFPWLVTANSVYRRSVLEAVGGFCEFMPVMEDVELAWKVFFSGYRLKRSDVGSVVHHDPKHRNTFYRKRFRYGMGVADLQYRFSLPAFRMPTCPLDGAGLPAWLQQQAFNLGYYSQRLRYALNSIPKPAPYQYSPMTAGHYPSFSWMPEISLQLSEHWVSWQNVRTGDYLVSSLPPGQTRSLSGSSALIWHSLLKGHSHGDVLAELKKNYSEPESKLAEDLNQFISHLIQERLVWKLEKAIL